MARCGAVRCGAVGPCLAVGLIERMVAFQASDPSQISLCATTGEQSKGTTKATYHPPGYSGFIPRTTRQANPPACGFTHAHLSVALRSLLVRLSTLVSPSWCSCRGRGPLRHSLVAGGRLFRQE